MVGAWHSPWYCLTPYHGLPSPVQWDGGKGPQIIKERICARTTSAAWMDHLPLVMLGIRTSVRPDTGLCPAELVFGSSLRLPGEFVAAPELPPAPLSSSFVDDLRRTMATFRPPAADHHRPSGPSPTVPPSLSAAAVTHVFVRVDAVRRPLTRPYDGPFKVLDKTPKTFTLLRSGKPWTVSVDRLKPAFGLDDVVPKSRPFSPASSTSSPGVPPLPAVPSVPVPGLVAGPDPRLAASTDTKFVTGANATVLRSGRFSRPPTRLDL